MIDSDMVGPSCVMDLHRERHSALLGVDGLRARLARSFDPLSSEVMG
jgi:hypothetical protein